MREGRGWGGAPSPNPDARAAGRPPRYLQVQLGDKKKGRRTEGDARLPPDAPLRAPPRGYLKRVIVTPAVFLHFENLDIKKGETRGGGRQAAARRPPPRASP